MTIKEIKTFALASAFLLTLTSAPADIQAKDLASATEKDAGVTKTKSKAADQGHSSKPKPKSNLKPEANSEPTAKADSDKSALETDAKTSENDNTQEAGNEEAAKPKIAPVRDKWALIVGISNFKDKSVPSLKYATKDANDFYKYLLNEASFSKDHVRILLDEDATERRIMSELGDKFLARLAKPEDVVVIFFSSHGSPSQLDVKNKNYLVAYDTDPKSLFSTGIEMQKMNEIIKERIDAKRILLVLDACHSGHVNVNKNAKGIYRVGNFNAEALAQGSGQMVICSSSPDEQSWESKRYKNGIFTRKLLENLRKNGTATPIQKAVEESIHDVNNEVKEDYPGARQNPQIHSAWKGEDLVLAVRPLDPQPVPKSVFDVLEPDSSPDNLRKRRSEQFVHGYNRDAGSEKLEKLTLTRTYFSDVEDPGQAYQAACEAQAAHFNEPDFYYRKALIQIQLKKYSAASQTLKGVIVDNPNKFEYYLARGYCFYKMGQKGLAMGDIRTAQFKNPLLPKSIEFGD